MRLDGIQFMRSMNIQRIPYLRPESDEPRSVSDDVPQRLSPLRRPKRIAHSDPGQRLSAAFVVLPTLLRPVLSRIGDSELGLTGPALGAVY
jgi:hypothetical protein